ncbi:hypothetical protein [Piscinibacter sp. XHJ-5]|uniref:hypothetical protein n=1 Tax=Piscinibacter sp. XHJ-5 TaxID=3037797 RepID=UPI002452C860|nr:hypothetical protein [Piscinibacter sp. XHJ-5]
MPIADERTARAGATRRRREQLLVPALCTCLTGRPEAAASTAWPPRDLGDLARQAGQPLAHTDVASDRGTAALTLERLMRLDRVLSRVSGRPFEGLSSAAQAALLRHVTAGTCPLCEDDTRAFLGALRTACERAYLGDAADAFAVTGRRS